MTISIPEAIKQYEQLVAAAPANPDFLRDWGKLVLKDESQDLEVRRKEAVRIWKHRLCLIARTMRSRSLRLPTCFARRICLTMLKRCMKKRCSWLRQITQYRQYLGEFYHIQKKTDDALKTWASIAEGKQRTAENILQAGGGLNSFGYLDQAVKKISDTCRLAPKEFVLQMHTAKYHMRAAKYDEALTFIDAADFWRPAMMNEIL